MKNLICAIAFGAMMCLAAPASSAELLFTISGTDSVSFKLDSNPTPDFAGRVGGSEENNTASYAALFYDVAGQHNGIDTLLKVAFFDARSGGGIEVKEGNGGIFYILSLLGPVVFQGTLDQPIFSPSSTSFTRDFKRGTVNDLLVISGAPVSNGGIPEPSSWALMLSGFLAAGAALRRRRRVSALG